MSGPFKIELVYTSVFSNRPRLLTRGRLNIYQGFGGPRSRVFCSQDVVKPQFSFDLVIYTLLQTRQTQSTLSPFHTPTYWSYKWQREMHCSLGTYRNESHNGCKGVQPRRSGTFQIVLTICTSFVPKANINSRSLPANYTTTLSILTYSLQLSPFINNVGTTEAQPLNRVGYCPQPFDSFTPVYRPGCLSRWACS